MNDFASDHDIDWQVLYAQYSGITPFALNEDEQQQMLWNIKRQKMDARQKEQS